MDGEVAGAKVKMMIREDNTTSVHAITLRVTRSLITNVLLIWSIHYGLELATQTKEYIGCEWDFHVGILTMVLGYVLLFVKLHNLLAISAEKLLQQAEENGTPQDMHQELAGKWQQQEEENGTHQAGEMTIHEFIVCLLVVVIEVFMLLWIIYTAFILVPVPIGDPDGQYSIYQVIIRVLVGFVTLFLCSLYFLIVLLIMLVLARDFSSSLQQKEKKEAAFM